MKTSLVRILQTLFRQKWIIITFFLVTVAVVNIASYTMAPIYSATAQFLVIPGSEEMPIYTSSGTVSDRAAPGATRIETVVSEMQLLRARPVIERVCDRIGLGDRATIDLGDGGPPKVEEKSFVKSLGDKIKAVNAAIHQTLINLGLVNVGDPRQGTIDALQYSLAITPVFSSNVFTVTYQDTDPRLAAMVVNTLAEEYLNYRQDVYKPPGVVDHFREQLELRKSELDEARERLRAYQDKYNIINLEAEIDNDLRLYEDAKKSNAFNPERDQYAARLEVLRAAAPVIRDLRFDVDNAQQLYERYAQKFDEVSSNAELNRAKFANVRLIQPAVVDWSPVFPHRLLNVFLSVFVGLIGGIGLALASSYFSDKINAVEDIEAINLRALGSVPLLKRRSERRQAYLADQCRRAAALIVEQLRTPGSAHGVVLRGTRAGVGCSTMAISLALAIAAAQRERVLLVDANMVDPAVHKALDTEDGPPVAPMGEKAAELEAAIQKTDHENLDILTAQQFKRLYESEPSLMVRLRDQLSDRYTFILVDTSPLFSVASPLRGVDGWSAILVVAARRTSIQVVRRAVDVLTRQGFAVMGAILNRRDDSLPGFIYRRL